jgi:hypothetical protein
VPTVVYPIQDEYRIGLVGADSFSVGGGTRCYINQRIEKKSEKNVSSGVAAARDR